MKGVVLEQCHWIVKLPGGHIVSASQLLWDKNFNLWRRAAQIHPNRCTRLDAPLHLYQLITSTES